MTSHTSHHLAPIVLVLGALVFIALGAIRLILDLDLPTGLAYLYDGLLFLLGGLIVIAAIRSTRNRYS